MLNRSIMRSSFLAALSVSLLGACGASSDVCGAAAAHVTACTGLEVKADTLASCDPEAAEALLASSCESITSSGEGKNDLIDWFKDLFSRKPTVCDAAQGHAGICLNGGFKWLKVECNAEQQAAAEWVLAQSWSDLCQNRDPAFREKAADMADLIGATRPRVPQPKK